MSETQSPSGTFSSTQSSSTANSSAPGDSIFPDIQLNTALITFRVLVSVKEAGIIIGKNGSCVSNVREKTGVKSGVSKVVIGCPERILTVSGPVESTAQALSMFAQALLEASNNDSSMSPNTNSFFPLKPLCSPPTTEGCTSLRILIPHSQMGTLIGKQGARIRALQENYDVSIVASKNFVYDSTERLVEIQGKPENIGNVLNIIAKCLIEDWHGATGTLFYIPHPRLRRKQNNSNYQQGNQRRAYNNQHHHNNMNDSSSSNSNDTTTDTVTQVIPFPSEYVGCLIGRRGANIHHVRELSGANISIEQDDNENDEKNFTITGNQYQVEKALSMLYQLVQKRKHKLEEGDDSNYE